MTRIKHFSLTLIASLAITLPTGSALAGSCSKGGCSGSSGAAKAAIASAQRQIKQARNKLESSQDGNVAEAYDTILKINAEAEKKSVASLSVVSEPMKAFAKDIELKAAEQYKAAKAEYDAGNYATALAQYEEVAKLQGLAAARKAKSELRKEDDRIAWREALAQSSRYINSHQFEEARVPVLELNRLARRTDYYAQTKQALEGFQEIALEEVTSAEKDIENERYGVAYVKLLAISQLTPIRAAAVKARQALKESSRIDGMQQAAKDYEEARQAEKRAREAEASAEKKARKDDLKEIAIAAAAKSR